ncbi:beta-1,3-glucan-binding protein [Procambarus clarkii]|uniref:beta-1,3-glucan-binding protein n=1 Tax=Procambarus clarkii TaxID=6728 RepID=UPI003742FC98
MRALYFLLVVCGALAADVVDPASCRSFPCLIFNDDFNDLNNNIWKPEITMSGGGKGEFQMYLNDHSLSYIRESALIIKPELTSNSFNEHFLFNNELNLGSACTDNRDFGCVRRGTSEQIINPIMSAKLTTQPSFAFRYGRVEVRAKMPRGDWLWPAIELAPRDSRYGAWPASGEVDIVESRGNTEYGNLGHQYAGSTLHWGPNPQANMYPKTHKTYSANDGSFGNNFHTWRLDWTRDNMKFYVDGQLQLTVDPGTNFWDLSGLGSSQDNPWRDGSKMAPFDQKFYIVVNLAVGGTDGYFHDGVAKNPEKPWSNGSPHAALDFWNGRESWLPTWKHGEPHISEEAALKVDYVKVWKMKSIEQ